MIAKRKNISASPFPINASSFFSIVWNSSNEKPPVVGESPVSQFLLSNQQAKTVLNKRVKRQWDRYQEERNLWWKLRIERNAEQEFKGQIR